MGSIIFHWNTPKGLDTPHGKKKLLSRWNLTCKAFGITDIMCVTKEDIKMGDREVRFRTFSDLDKAINASKGTIVAIEQGGSSLSEFKHPEDAIYIFGSDYDNLDYFANKISIPSLLPVHAETACGIILASRYQQWH
jgi:hypothetical protein